MSAKKFSALPTATPADADLVSGIDDSAATPAAKNANFLMSAIASYVLGKREAVMSQGEAEAGVVTDRRGITPQRLAQAIAALGAGPKVEWSATRAPTGTDDATQGYAAQSLWRWGDRVWIAASVATNIAVWIEITAGTLPDVVSQAEAEGGTATDARLWTAERVAQAIDALAEGATLPDVVSQAEAEGGTATDPRLWTAERVAQAIDALAEGATLPDVVSQAEAEGGTATDPRLWTAERVAQAIAALADSEAPPSGLPSDVVAYTGSISSGDYGKLVTISMLLDDETVTLGSPAAGTAIWLTTDQDTYEVSIEADNIVANGASGSSLRIDTAPYKDRILCLWTTGDGNWRLISTS